MSYFVAEDVVHVRPEDAGGFVSACGYEYERSAVDWADDYEPEAWPACEDCLSAHPGMEPLGASVIVVSGTYALDDDAHLLVGRDGSRWLSACGRIDENEAVDWAGHEWPQAYSACPACAALVDDAVLSQPGEPSDDESDDTQQASIATKVRQHRLWVLSDDGTEHRPADDQLRRAMCGAHIRPDNVRRNSPFGGPSHCHECDRAVGVARAAVRPGKPTAKPKRVPKRPVQSRAKTVPTAHKKALPARKNPRRVPVGTDKEIALYGRKMVVPVRFVRGGLPGLGRRR